MHKNIAVISAAAIALIAAPALAMPHGKPGLWTIVSTMHMASMPDLPPDVLAMMKKRGMPGFGQPVTTQMCMTNDEVKEGAAAAQRIQSENGIKCTPKVLSETGASVTTEIVCHGEMEGVGRSTIAWRGDGHYEGDYAFKGSTHGMSQDLKTHYVGDWVKSDCGSVKPFKASDIPHRPPPH